MLLTLAFALAMPAVTLGQTTPAQPVPRAETRERNLKAYTELLRADLRSQKVAVFTALMTLDDKDDAAFWPIYRQHEAELGRLNDERLKVIEAYAKEYQTLSPASARRLVEQALDLEARRTKLKQDYFAKLSAAISPLAAARALQIEHQIQLLVDLQTAASLPIVETTVEDKR
jgi:hypothetical protein